MAHSDVYGCYGVKMKALMDVKGRGSIQQGAAFNQRSLCVKSIIHLLTVSATRGFCLCKHTVASREVMVEMHLIYSQKCEENKVNTHSINFTQFINNVLVPRCPSCKSYRKKA